MQRVGQLQIGARKHRTIRDAVIVRSVSQERNRG
jgi:hypothetical protein